MLSILNFKNLFKKLIPPKIRISIKYKLANLQGKQVVHFLHIGKTGGTAIIEAIKYNLTNNKYIIQIHGHDFRLKDVPIGHKCFFCLRDPISRFVSGFYSRKRKGQPKYNNPWKINEEIAFNQFSTPNELAFALSSEDINVQESAIKAMKNIGHVKSHYWDWFHDKEYFVSRIEDIMFVGYQENLECDFEKLKKILLLPNSLQLPQDKVISHRSNSNEDKHLDDKAKQNLMLWYAQDYKFIKLCKEKKIN